MKFLSPEVALYLHKSTIRSCMVYCFHICAGAPSCYLELLVLHLLLLLKPWFIIEMWPAWVFSIGITLVDVPQNWLNWFHFFFLEGGLLVIVIDCMNFSITISRCYKDVYVNSFFPHTARLWNSLPRECFPLTCDLSGFKCRINRHLLTIDSFLTDFLYGVIFLCFFFL